MFGTSGLQCNYFHRPYVPLLYPVLFETAARDRSMLSLTGGESASRSLNDMWLPFLSFNDTSQSLLLLHLRTRSSL